MSMRPLLLQTLFVSDERLYLTIKEITLGIFAGDGMRYIPFGLPL